MNRKFHRGSQDDSDLLVSSPEMVPAMSSEALLFFFFFYSFFLLGALQARPLKMSPNQIDKHMMSQMEKKDNSLR